MSLSLSKSGCSHRCRPPPVPTWHSFSSLLPPFEFITQTSSAEALSGQSRAAVLRRCLKAAFVLASMLREFGSRSLADVSKTFLASASAKRGVRQLPPKASLTSDNPLNARQRK